MAAHFGLLFELSGVLAVLAAAIVACGVLISRFDQKPLEESIYGSSGFRVGFRRSVRLEEAG